MAGGFTKGPRRMIAGLAGAQAAAADLARARAGDDQDDDLDPEELESTQRVFAAAEKYFKARRMYDKNYPGLERFLDEFEEKLIGHLNDHEDLTVQFVPAGVQFHGHPAYEAERLDQNMWYPLYRDGIRELTFSTGLVREEISEFFHVLAVLSLRKFQTDGHDDPDEDEEDDAVTMLWDLDLENIGYVAIDSFAEGADSGEGASAERVERMREMVTVSMMKDLSRTTHPAAKDEIVKKMKTISLSAADLTFLESENLAALDELPVNTRESRGDMFQLERWEMVLLNDGMREDPEVVEKFLEALVRAMLTVGHAADDQVLVARLAQFFEAIVVDGKFARAAQLRRHIAALIQQTSGEEVDYDLLDAIDRAMATPRTIQAICNAIAAAEGREQLEEIVALVTVLPHVAAGSMIEHLEVVTDSKLRRAFLDVMARWGRPALQAAIPAIPMVSEELGLDLLYLVRQIGGDGALEVLDQATRHPKPRVRAEATRFYTDLAAPPLAEKRARSAMHDNDALVRRAGLDYVIARRPQGAVRWIKESIDADKFGELEFAEKKRLFIAYAALGGDQVAGELIERVKKRNLWGKGDLDEERAAAAAGLGQLRHAEARDALDKVAKSKLTRGIVKEACLEAIAAMDRPESSSRMPAVQAPAAVPEEPAPAGAQRLPAAHATAQASPPPVQQATSHVSGRLQPKPTTQPPPVGQARPTIDPSQSPGFRISTTRQRESIFADEPKRPAQPRPQPRAQPRPQPAPTRQAPAPAPGASDAERSAGAYRTPAQQFRRHPALGGGKPGGSGGEDR